MWFGVVIAVLAVVVGLVLAFKEIDAELDLPPITSREGWVYFLTPIGGGDDDPPAPIKVGMTHRDPATERLPEIETMSPQRLELIATIYSNMPERLESEIHKELVAFRHHGEWYDRDATLAWLYNFKETA